MNATHTVAAPITDGILAGDVARGMLLAAAARILSRDGVAALTVRRVAEQVGASTKMVYTHFGGMDGLLNALYLHSFAKLTTALDEQASLRDPGERLRAMTDAYRAFALAEPSLYQVMFGDSARAWTPSQASRREAWLSFRTLRDSVAVSLDHDDAGLAGRATHLLWAAMHGVVSLELRGLISPSEDPTTLYRCAVGAVAQTYGLPLTPSVAPCPLGASQ